MKNILSILVVSVFLFGCSKSGDNLNDIPGSILGTWEIQSTTQSVVYGYIDPILGTEIETDSYTDIYTPSDTVKFYLVYRYDNTHTCLLYTSPSPRD